MLKECKCDRCNGTGIVKEWADPNHLDGMCFKCKGSGYVMIDLEKEEIKRAKRTKKQADKYLNGILEPTRKAVSKCNNKKGCLCKDCKHKEYCNLFFKLETQENTYKEMINNESKVKQ